jgi:predicted lactoylglutathione lyase
MSRMIFVNLPVTDLAASRRFLEALGGVNEPKFTDDTAACMTISESIHVMVHAGAHQRCSNRDAGAALFVC